MTIYGEPRLLPCGDRAISVELGDEISREVTARILALDYLIRRDDGDELHVEVRCWNAARTAAERAGNAPALEAIADRGLGAALESAELAEAPGTRGAVGMSSAR